MKHKVLCLLTGAFLLLMQTPVVAQHTAELLPPFQIDLPDQSIPALEWDVLGMDGQRWFLSQLKGQVVLLNFWATWCVPCVEELPALNRLAEKLKSRNFVVLAVNVREPHSRVDRFLQKHDFAFLQFGLDLKGSTYKKYGVSQFPTSFIIDRQGRFVGRIRGARQWDISQSVQYFQKLVEGA